MSSFDGQLPHGDVAGQRLSPPLKRAEKSTLKNGACSTYSVGGSSVSSAPSCSGILKEEAPLSCAFSHISDADLQLKNALSRLAVTSRKSSVSRCSTTLSLATLLPSSSSLHSDVSSQPPIHSTPLLPPDSEMTERLIPMHPLQQPQEQQQCINEFTSREQDSELPLLPPQAFLPPSTDFLISHQHALVLQQRIERRQQQLVEQQIELLGQQQRLAEALRRSAWEKQTPSFGAISDANLAVDSYAASSCAVECGDIPVLLQQQRKRPQWMASRRTPTLMAVEGSPSESSAKGDRSQLPSDPPSTRNASLESVSATALQPFCGGGENWMHHRRCQPWRGPRETQSAEQDSTRDTSAQSATSHPENRLSNAFCLSVEEKVSTSQLPHADHWCSSQGAQKHCLQQSSRKENKHESLERTRAENWSACSAPGEECPSLHPQCLDSEKPAFFDDCHSREAPMDSLHFSCGGFSSCNLRQSLPLNENLCFDARSREATCHFTECPACTLRVCRQSCRGCLSRGRHRVPPSLRRIACRCCCCSEVPPPCACRGDASDCLYTPSRACPRSEHVGAVQCGSLPMERTEVATTDAASRVAAAAASQANAAAAAAAVAALEVAAAAAAATPEVRLSAETPQNDPLPVASADAAQGLLFEETSAGGSGCPCCPPERVVCDCEKECCLSELLGRGVLGRRRWKQLLRTYSGSCYRRASSGRSSDSEEKQENEEVNFSKETKNDKLRSGQLPELPASVKRCLETRLSIRRQAMRESLELRRTFLRAAGSGGESKDATDFQSCDEGDANWWLQQAEECFEKEKAQVQRLLQREQRPARRKRGDAN